jgi:outer membrane protein assembly factor BamB
MKKSRLLILIGIVGLVGAGVLFWQKRQPAAPSQSPKVTTTTDATAAKTQEDILREELAQIQRDEAALAPADRLTAWEHDFRGEVLSVAPGKNCFYYLLHLSNSAPEAPGRQNLLPFVSVNRESSDWRHAVVCVDLKTGHVRWAREVNGLVNLAVAPDTDVLHLYREKLISLAPESGAVTESFDLPEHSRASQGLLIQGKIIPRLSHASPRLTSETQFQVVDFATKTNKTVKVANYWLLSPDENRRLVRKGSAWNCVNAASGQVVWSAPEQYDERWLPFWHGTEAILVRGSEQQLGVITAIDSATGKPRWKTVLGWGMYESGQHQLRGGGYPDQFSPVAKIENHLLALDGSGRLYFLNPATGQRMAAPQLARAYLGMPVQSGQQLIVCSPEWLRSYSLSALLKSGTSPQVDLLMRKAKCLQALHQSKEALQVLDWLVERMPESATVWAERARACESLGNPDEEVFSRCQALVTSQKTEDETLRKHWGLIRLYHFDGKPGWPVAHVDGQVYVGTLAGSLWSVQADSLDLGLVGRLDHEITALATKPEIQAILGNSTHTRRPVPQVTKSFDQNVPREWYTEGGPKRFSNAIQYRGRQFRSMVGGVRILSGTNMQELISPLKDLGEWHIHQSPFGPLGYGAGVFELDANLCPTNRLIRPMVSGKSSEPGTVMFMASTAQSVALIVASRNGAVLQTYTRDGTFLNELSLGRYTSGWAGPAQLISLGNGFLFSDRQLAWLSATKENRSWIFGPSLGRTSTERWGERWRYFGDPMLLNGCLYVTGIDGSLYVFDPSSIAAAGK